MPAATTACPHCEADTRSSKLRLLCGVVGGSTIAFTLMACYGAAPRHGEPLDATPPAPDATAPSPDGGR